MEWKTVLAYVTGTVNQELLMRNEYLVAENRILWNQITERIRLIVWTKSGLVTYYVLFYIQVGTRKIHIAGLTQNPNEAWMKQMARSFTIPEWGFFTPGQYLLHDRDAKFCSSWQAILTTSGVTHFKLPAPSPNLNAHAER